MLYQRSCRWRSSWRDGVRPIGPVGETLKGVEFSSWLGLAVAPGTPRSTIDTLNRELRTILALDETRERFAGFGGVPAPTSPEQMASRVEQEVASWNRVVQTRGIERQ